MTVQTIDIGGERYVIIAERDYLRLRVQAGESGAATPKPNLKQPVFKEIEPLKIPGEPASETLIRDRR